MGTFNVLNGRSLHDDLVSTDRLVSACASLEADVLCLQEVDRNQPRSAGTDQTAAIAAGMGAEAWRFEPSVAGVPGGHWQPAGHGGPDGGPAGGGPSYGIALVSRLPVRAWHVVPLGTARIRSPVYVPGKRGRFILLPDEPRIGLVAEVETSCGVVLIANTHLSFVPGWNAFQLWRLTRKLAEMSRVSVLLGDLNLPPPFPRMASGWRPLAAAKTFPAGDPRIQIDHVLAHGWSPAVTGVEARHMPLSDHRALLVDLVVEGVQ